jgi:hypothetical protein
MTHPIQNHPIQAITNNHFSPTTDEVQAILAYSLLDRIWSYLLRSYDNTEAKTSLHLIISAQNEILSAFPLFSQRSTIVEFNRLAASNA